MRDTKIQSPYIFVPIFDYIKRDPNINPLNSYTYTYIVSYYAVLNA